MGNNSYEYGADGYIAKKTTVVDAETTEVTTYSYSSQGRLLEVVTPSKTITYKHNALGNRVAKLVDGEVVEKYLWLDKITLLATYDKDDKLVQRFEYVLGNTPTSYTEGGNKYYIISDHLGTPRAITNADGDVLKQVDYDSFGNVISDSNPAISIPFGFAGGLADSDTGLVRFGYRDYDPETGRWTARDPIGFAGGDTNLYGYTFNDPLNFVDSDGLFAWIVAGAGVGALINVVATVIANGGDVSLSQIGSAALSGAISGAVGAIAGPVGGTLAKIAGCSSAGKTAAAGAISAAGAAAGQAAANAVDPCNASSVANAALFGGIGGAVGKYAFPTPGMHTMKQSDYFAPSTFSGVNTSSFSSGAGASAGVGAASNFGGPF